MSRSPARTADPRRLARRAAQALAAAAAIVLPADAWAWGATGHRLVSLAAMSALPFELPSFLRTPAAAAEIAELSREPDRWRNAGRLHDNDRDAAHFLDLDDQGRVEGGPLLSDLPPTRAAYAAALRAVATDEVRAGYLPYAIVDAWQQLAKDFGYWRAVSAASARAADPARKAWYAADLERRRQLILRDLGVLSHYVADASQPLHVTGRHNGWTGDNPKAYATGAIHAPIEGAFVRANIKAPMVEARLAPYRPCGCTIEARTAAYLATGAALVEPLYALEKAGGFKGGDARGVDFTVARLAAGSSELRDMVLDAWKASERANVGYPIVWVSDIEAGKVDPFDSLYGAD
jgi:hypothetical protein